MCCASQRNFHCVACSTMVYYARMYGKCHVCRICTPGTWFRCVICGAWMGMHCNPRKLALARTPFGSEESDIEEENLRRYLDHEVTLHCYIWTSDAKDIKKRADLCAICCSNRLLPPAFPTGVKRKIWEFVSWGSWW